MRDMTRCWNGGTEERRNERRPAERRSGLQPIVCLEHRPWRSRWEWLFRTTLDLAWTARACVRAVFSMGWSNLINHLRQPRPFSGFEAARSVARSVRVGRKRVVRAGIFCFVLFFFLRTSDLFFPFFCFRSCFFLAAAILFPKACRSRLVFFFFAVVCGRGQANVRIYQYIYVTPVDT